MIDDLSECSEIGVDVEHHSYRSYLGLTCLIQISTCDKDYIVDPFPLWNEESLIHLNVIFGKFLSKISLGHKDASNMYHICTI